MEAIFWGVVLRILQAALQASPFILTGLIITGVLHRLLGHHQTRQVFGSNTTVSLIQSWLLGMILPGCSLGVIPIVKQLRKSGIAVGTIFSFALSSPLFDPLSLLYGLTLSKPMTIVAFAFCSLAVVTVSGSLFDWLFPDTEVTVAEPPACPKGGKRLLSILVVMARESVSDSALLIVCGLVGVGLLSAVLPPGSLQTSMSHENPYSPLLMTAIAIPAYTTPMTAMAQLGSMFQHGNSVGAAFILLVFGAGMNLGLLAWMFRHYGWKKTGIWMLIMLTAVLILSYGIERPLYPTSVEPADHTHAFDSFCQPFQAASPPSDGYVREIWHRVRMETQLHETIAAGLLCSVLILGFALSVLDWQGWSIENWLQRHEHRPVHGRWDIDVPNPILGMVALVAIIMGSIVGCFAYYPEPAEAFEELRIANTEALSASLRGDHQHALHWIPVSEGWLRRLQVGAYLRSGHLNEEQQTNVRLCQDNLESLEHLIEDRGSSEEIRKQVAETSTAFTRLRNAFTGS